MLRDARLPETRAGDRPGPVACILIGAPKDHRTRAWVLHEGPHQVIASEGRLHLRGFMTVRAVSLPDYRMPAEWEPHEAVWLQWPEPDMRGFPGYARKMQSTLLKMTSILTEQGGAVHCVTQQRALAANAG